MNEMMVPVSLNDTAETVEKIMDTKNLSCIAVINTDRKCFGVISAPDLRHFHQARKTLWPNAPGKCVPAG